MLGHTETRPFVAAMTELLNSFRPDVVHFHHLSRIGLETVALIRRLLPRTRMLLTLHDYFAICANDGPMTAPALDGSAARLRRPAVMHASRKSPRAVSSPGRCMPRT